MKFCEEVYGADADNNRGVASISYEIETSDNDEIIYKLYDLFLDGTTTGEHNIFMYCYLIDDDIEITVNIENYIDGLIEKAKEDENIKDDEELQEWIKWLKLEVKEENIIIGYLETIDKTDYIYNINKELIEKIYNNDYKVAKILSKLSKEVKNGK